MIVVAEFQSTIAISCFDDACIYSLIHDRLACSTALVCLLKNDENTWFVSSVR